MEDETASTVAAVRAGDRQAYGALVERYWLDAVRLARSVAGELEAEDVAQDAFVAAWSALAQLSRPASFRPWLMRIVYRRAVRRSRWRRLASLATAAEPQVTPDPAAEIDLGRLLARLAPRQRAVLHLTIVEEMSDSEIGEALGIAAGSVRAHRRRARERLAQLIGREWHDD